MAETSDYEVKIEPSAETLSGAEATSAGLGGGKEAFSRTTAKRVKDATSAGGMVHPQAFAQPQEPPTPEEQAAAQRAEAEAREADPTLAGHYGEEAARYVRGEAYQKAFDVSAQIKNGAYSLADADVCGAVIQAAANAYGLRAAAFYDEDFRKEFFGGKPMSIRETAEAFVDIFADTETRDVLNEKKWKTAQLAAENGDPTALNALCNKAAYGDRKENYKKSWSPEDVKRLRLASSDKVRVAQIFSGMYGEEATRAGLVSALFLNRGKTPEEILDSGIYAGLSEEEQAAAMYLGDELRAGYEPGAGTLAKKFAQGFGETLYDTGTGMLRMVLPDEIEKAHRVADIYKKYGNVDGITSRSDLRELIDLFDMKDAYANDWDRYDRGGASLPKLKPEAWSELEARAKQMTEVWERHAERKKMLDRLEAQFGEDKMYNYGEAFGFAMKAAEIAGAGTAQAAMTFATSALTGGVGGLLGVGARGAAWMSRFANAAAFAAPVYADKLDEYRAQGMSEKDAQIMAFGVGAMTGVTEVAGMELLFGKALSKAVGGARKRALSAAQKEFEKRAGRSAEQAVGAKAAQESAAAMAAFKSGALRKLMNGAKDFGKSYLTEAVFEEGVQQALESAIELSSDYWREDGQDLFTLEGEAKEFAENMAESLKYGWAMVLPMHGASRFIERGRGPRAKRSVGLVEGADGKVQTLYKGVSLLDATAAETAVQAYDDAISQVKARGIPEAARKAWKPDMTAEEREAVAKEHKLKEADIAVLDAMNHYERTAEKLGDKTIETERLVEEYNREVDDLSREDEKEASAEVSAAEAAEEAPSVERQASSEAIKDNAEWTQEDGKDGNEERQAPSVERQAAVEAQDAEALKRKAAELDDKLRGKGLKKAEREALSKELAETETKLRAANGGNLVLFKKGVANPAAVPGAEDVAPRLSPKKAALRERLLAQIAKTSGVKIVRESSEQIAKAAAKATGARLNAFSGSRYDENAEVPVVEIETPLDIDAQKNTPKLREEIFKPLVGQEVEIQSDGRIVIFDNRSKDALKKRGIHRAVLPELKTLIEQSRYFDYRENDGQDKHKGILGQLVYAVPVRMNGKIYRCELVIDRKVSSERGKGSFKQQSVFSIADTKITEVAMSSGAQSAHGVDESHGSPTTSVMSMRMGELMEGRKPKTPSVMFKREVLKHGSPHLFEAEDGAPYGRFRDEKMGTGEGAQVFGWGHYLTSREGIAKAYAENNAQKLYSQTNSEPGVLIMANNLRNIVEAYRRKANLTAAEQARVADLETRLAELDADVDVFLAAEVAEGDRREVRRQLSLCKMGYWRRKENGFVVAESRLEPTPEEKATGGWELVKYPKRRLDALTKKDAELTATIEAAKKLFKEKYSIEGKRHLYTAEIETGENDANLLDWTRVMTDEQKARILAQAREEFGENGSGMLDVEAAFAERVGEDMNARMLHQSRWMGKAFGSPMGISKFLRRAGFVGHKFPAQSGGTGDYSRGTNYVIYEGGDAEITGRVSWLASNGVIYGYFDEGSGKLHLNEDFADFDTPIHEWTHVWWAWVEKNDARLTERIVNLCKMTREFKTFKAQALRDKESAYHGMTDEELAQEVFARLCGKRGEDIMAQEGLSTWAKIRRAALDFFRSVLRTLGLSEEALMRLTFEDAQKMCLRDLFDDETLGIKGLRARLTNRAALNDAIDNAALDNGIEDAAQKRRIRNASVVAAARLIKKHAMLRAQEVNEAREEILGYARQALPTETSDVHEAVADVAALYAKMVYSTREAGAEAIKDANAAVKEVSRVRRALRTEKILNAIYKKGVIDAELFAEAKEYVDRYTRMISTGRGSKAKGLSWEEVNAAFGGERGLVRTLLADREHPEAATLRISQLVEAKLGADAKPWDVLNATRLTLRNAYRRVAKTWVHSAAREQALRAADGIEDADSLAAVLEAGVKAEKILREKGVRLTMKALTKQTETLIGRILSKKGDVQAKTEERRYTGAFVEFAKALGKHFKTMARAATALEDAKAAKNPARAAELTARADELRDALNDDIQATLRSMEETGKGTAARQALEARYAALRLLARLDFFDAESMAEFHESIRALEERDADTKANEKAVFEEQVEADAAALTSFVNAREGKSQYDEEQSVFGKLFGWVAKYAFGLTQRLEMATRYATGEARKARNALVKRLHEAETDANLRKEKEAYRRKAAFRAALADELGVSGEKELRAFSRKLNEKRESLARFSRSGKAALSYDQVLNLYLGLRQSHVSGVLLGMDEETREAYFERRPEARKLWAQIEQMSAMREALESADLMRYGDLLCRLLGDERLRLNEACAEYFGADLMLFPEDAEYFPISRMRTGGVNLDGARGATTNIVPSAVLPRIANARPLNDAVSATAAFLHQIDETEHFAAYGAMSRYYSALFANEDFVTAVRDKFGSQTLMQLHKAASDTVNGQFFQPDDVGYSDLLNASVDLASVLILGFNAGTMLKQMSSFLSFANEIGWMNTFRAMTLWADGGVKERLKEMMSHPLWHARYQGNLSQKHIDRIMGGGRNRAADAWRRYAEFSMLTVRGGDAAAVLIVGQGLYGATKAKLMRRMNPRTMKLFTEAEARDAAMAAVMDIADRTQQAGRTANFNAVQRRGGAAGRLIGQFKSSVGQMFAAELAAISEVAATKGRDAEARRKLTAVLINNHIVIPTLSWAAAMLVQWAFTGDAPDEDDWRDLVFAALLGQFGGLFLFGGLLEAAGSNRAYGEVSYPALSSATRMLFGTTKLAGTLFDGEDGTTAKAAFGLGKNASAATRQAVNFVDAWITDLDGKD